MKKRSPADIARTLRLSFFALFTAALSTNASVLWDNGTPNFSKPYLFVSDFDFPQDPARGIQAGDDFVLQTDATARQVQWWGAYSSGFATQPDLFTIRFFDFIGSPATVPLFSYTIASVERVDTGAKISAYELYHYTALIPDSFLTGGHYFLSVVNDTTGTPDDWAWAASTQFGNGMSAYRDHDGQPWNTLNVEFAFKITDSRVQDVPERGSSVFLLGIGTAGLWLLHWRTRLLGLSDSNLFSKC